MKKTCNCAEIAKMKKIHPDILASIGKVRTSSGEPVHRIRVLREEKTNESPFFSNKKSNKKKPGFKHSVKLEEFMKLLWLRIDFEGEKEKEILHLKSRVQTIFGEIKESAASVVEAIQQQFLGNTFSYAKTATDFVNAFASEGFSVLDATNQKELIEKVAIYIGNSPSYEKGKSEISQLGDSLGKYKAEVAEKLQMISEKEPKIHSIFEEPRKEGKLSKQASESREKFGEFIFDDDKIEDLGLPFKEPHKYENGSIYHGQWKGEKRHGRGRQVWSDGSMYEGYWEDDSASRTGRLFHADGDVYWGNWLKDKAHGKGKYTHWNGTTYDGSWVEDKQCGMGTETWPDGAQYKGQYKGGQKHGYGVFNWSEGAMYKGEFDHNVICGKGEYRWADGRVFNGDWKGNKMDGKGEFRWPDGRIYKGEYANDMKVLFRSKLFFKWPFLGSHQHGFGVFQWPDQRVYEGYWKEGKQHGEGLMTTTLGGIKHKGLWQEGKRVKWLDE